MGNHALLSASSSHRWLNCPPSARLGENYEDKGSDFAAEGTDAHSLCEHKLKTALGIPSEDPTENLTWYNEEMEECASGYAAYVLELLAEAKKVTTDPIQTTLYATVFSWDENITDTLDENQFIWTRVSDDPEADAVWNADHFGGAKSIEITSDDVEVRATFFCDLIDTTTRRSLL